MTKKITLVLGLFLGGCVASPDGSSGFIVEDGLYVRSFADGSAGVAVGTDVLDFGWTINCTIDAMSDRRTCSLYSETGGIFVDYGAAATPQLICIMGHDFPGRRGQIRVDANPPMSTDSEGCVRSSSLLKQLTSGRQVTTRRVEWPYDYPRDHSHTLTGFNKALEVAARIRNGTMPITAR